MIVFAAMVRVGWAQSLPADRPNPGTAVQATTVLTVADARSLVSTRNAAPDQQAFGDLDLSHVSEISPEAAAVLEGLPPPTGLLLNGLKSIGADVATALARSRCRQLSLNGLTEISPVVAAALAGYAGDPTADDPNFSQLNLDGVKDLPPSVLAVLGESRAGVLTLNGLTNIGADGARSLRNFEGVFVGLNGLESLTTDVAELLGRMRWRVLGLDGVRELSVESARGLATFEGNSLHLSGLARVSAAAAKELGHCRCKLLQLNGLTELSPEAAESLAGFNGAALGLRRIAEVSVATAERLAGFRGRSLDLSGLQHPSDEVVRALLHCRGASLPADIETRVLASGDATLDVPYAATDERKSPKGQA